VNAVQAALTPEVIAKRTKRHLDELEVCLALVETGVKLIAVQRSNYAEPSTSFLGEDDDDEGSGKYAKGRARNIISDKRAVGKKKKSTMAVRSALLYRKNLSTLIDESVSVSRTCGMFPMAHNTQGIASLPVHVANYLTAVTVPPSVPPRIMCSVCGYWGRYKCRRCAMPYCGKACEDVHGETRCERRVA
jgi:zinc finger HIT domain-containing protein 1